MQASVAQEKPAVVFALHVETATGLILQGDKGMDFRTFRAGRFGLEKWHQAERTMELLAPALTGEGPLDR